MSPFDLTPSATATDGYCTVSDVGAMFGSFSTPSGWDSNDITAAIASEADRIDTVTRSHFRSTSKTIYASGDGTPYLSLLPYTQWPCLSITSITFRQVYAASDDFDANGTACAATTYRLSPSKHNILRILPDSVRVSINTSSVIWISGDENYRVIGAFGRDVTPDPIKWANVLLVRELMQPGYAVQFEQPIQEAFADGYRYTMFRERARLASSFMPLTGIRIVDVLLRPFVNQLPILSVPR